MPAPVLLPLERLLFPEPVSGGMNPLVLLSLAYRYRSGNDHAKPIVVTVEGANFRIADGRHRALASMVAGRKTVLARVRR